MRKMLSLALILCAVFFCSSLAFATTYYVSTSGSDSWPGSSSQPWRTLQYAVDTIAAGDTIIVRSGTYVGCRITKAGTSGAPKTLQSETQGGAILTSPSAGAKHSGVLEIEDFTTPIAYWVVDGFEVNGQSTYRAIDTRGISATSPASHITVRNCNAHHAKAGASVSTGIFDGFHTYPLYENNVSHENTEHGFYHGNTADYGTLRNNVSYNNAGCGFHCNGDSSMGGSGLMRYITWEKNTAYGNGANGGAAINCDGVNSSKILNNLTYSNIAGGITIYAGDGSEASGNVIYNNTILMPSNGRYAVNIPASSGKPDPINNKVKNNILYNASSTKGSITTYSTSITGFESDYNVVIDRFSVNDDSSSIPLATWRTYGWDTHSLISNPTALFVNPGSNDYHLKDGSPAINAGTTLSDVTTDKDGVSRPQGSAYDIGCYEKLESTLLQITTTSLPNGQVGAAYSQTLQATGGTPPYTWSIPSGSLPAGLSLSSSTGAITGTPTTAQTSNFTARVTDNVSATDDQALSITINPAGSGPTYQFSSSDTESSTTSTSWQNKVTLAFTPSASDAWLVFAFAEYKGSNSSYSTLVRLTVDGTTEADITAEPKDTTDYASCTAMKAVTLSAASHTLKIDYRSENAAATARIRNARVVAIRKDALTWHTAASDATTALTTTMTNYATLNFTPAASGDYLVIWSAEFSANTGYSTLVEARYGGTAWDSCSVEAKDNTDYYTFMSLAEASCDTSQQTVTVAAAKESGSSATHNVRRCRIAAIRLTDGRFANSAGVSSDAEATTTSTAWQQKLTKSWNWGNAGNWLLFTSFRLGGSSTSYSTEARVQLNDATTMAQPLREPQDTTDYMTAGCVDVRSLASGTRLLDIDYRSENASATAKIRYARFYGLPLD